MADRIGTAIIELGADSKEFQAAIEAAARQMAGLTQNFKDTGTKLDTLASGMSAAGKEASASGKLIAGMSQSGREELARLAEAGTQPVSAFKQIVSFLGPMQAAIAGAFSVTAIIGFAKGVGEFAGHIADLSDETSISTTRLQAWNYLVGDAGLTIDDFATATQHLQKRLAGDDDSAVAAVEHLGLSVEALLAKAPDEAFIDIAEAAAKLTNHGEQTTLMFDLLGRTGSKALRLVREDLGKAVDDIEHSGGVITDELIHKADQFDEAWSHAWMRFRAEAVNAVDLVRRAFMQYQPDNAAMPKLPGAPNLGPTGAGPTISGATPAELRALDEQAAKIRENVAAWEQHKQAVADWVAEVTGGKAIAAIQELQNRFLSLTPAQRANKDTVTAVIDEYVKLQQRVGTGVAPVLDELFQKHITLTEKSRELSQQLMLTTIDFGAAAQSAGELIPPLLETANAFDANTQQAAGVSIMLGHDYAKATALARVATIDTWGEIDQLSRSFEQLANISGPTMGEVTRGIASVTSATSVAHTSWGTLTKGFKEFTGGSGLKDILGGLSGIVGGIGGIVAAAQAAIAGIKALVNAFKSDQTKFVNKPRDQFFSQFGNDKDSQYQNLANELTSMSDGDTANRLITALYDADNADNFKAAQQAIADVFSAAGKDIKMFGTGGIAMGPTFGIFGEKEPEAVLPLSRLDSMFSGGRETVQTITITLDGRQLAKSVVRNMPRELHLAGVGAF